MYSVILLIIVAAMSYLAGGINGAIVTSHLVYHKNIREYGSGNPGLTNFYRTFGKNAVLLVLLIDISKAVIPILLGGYIVDLGFSFGSAEERVLLGKLFAGFFVVVGHCFPIYYKFKGGKGVLAGGSAILVVDWKVALIVWSVFIIIVVLTRYVSLGSILAGICYPVGTIIFLSHEYWAIVLSLATGGLIVWRHSGNIVRLFKREEPKFSFKRKPADKS